MSSEARYYVSRGGPVGGPHSLAELKERVERGELGAEDQACPEGEQTWGPLFDLPAFARPTAATRLASEFATPAAASQAAPAVATANPPAPAKRASRLPPSYAPGAKPTLPGLYLPFEGSVEALALRMAQLDEVAPPSADPLKGRRQMRLVLVLVLFGAGLGAALVDATSGFPRPVFSMLMPYAWLGILVASTALRPAAGWRFSRLAWWLVGLAFVAGTAWLLAVGGASGGPCLWAFGSVLMLLLLYVGRLQGSAALRSLERMRPRLVMTRRLFEALSEDAAPNRRLGGWLDLTGPAQPHKLTREGKHARGHTVQLYRDEWLRLRLPLRDGNELRVSGVERCKLVPAHWRRGRSGKRKQRSEVSQHSGLIDVRLRVNEARYAVVPPADGTSVTIGPGAVISAAVREDATFEDLLGAVASLYRTLTPRPGAAA